MHNFRIAHTVKKLTGVIKNEKKKKKEKPHQIFENM